ncbi:MAG: TlpA family protein disulfide reductase [Pseudomonadales bacterium]|nr:TlpA family protein disulfide reductase [Halioglobus sp.]MCP5121804.1 TlpA family protein disulfide reductase [Pseudomonadales bacterium]MCP5192657.1 TlpA family protein disulfide reductase [Pseudomonadales bacterium]
MRALLLLVLVIVAPLVSAASATGPAANFTLKSAGGENIRLSEYRGQVVLLNFWASWCGPCRQEMPELDALHRKYASLGFTVFGVNVEQDRAMAAKILRDIPVSFPILFDDDNVVSQLYEVDAMPVTVLVDRYGDIRFMHRGYKPGYELEYEQQLRALIRE